MHDVINTIARSQLQKLFVCFAPKTTKTQIQKRWQISRYERSNIDWYKNSNVTRRQNLLTSTWKEKKETNCLISCLLISTGKHNPASNWKLTRLRQVGYRLDTSRYLLTVSRTHSSPRLDLIHQAGNYKGKKEYGKIKTEGDGKEERIDSIFLRRR